MTYGIMVPQELAATLPSACVGPNARIDSPQRTRWGAFRTPGKGQGDSLRMYLQWFELRRNGPDFNHFDVTNVKNPWEQFSPVIRFVCLIAIIGPSATDANFQRGRNVSAVACLISDWRETRTQDTL
jgi:hypothetical protein